MKSAWSREARPGDAALTWEVAVLPPGASLAETVLLMD